MGGIVFFPSFIYVRHVVDPRIVAESLGVVVEAGELFSRGGGD